jgi:flagellar protein FlbT
MSKPMHISLRAGERIFINGAVVRADRKVTLELMNDVTFLLESHVLQVEATTTPLRQLYFVVQTMLIDPAKADKARLLFADLHASALEAFKSESVLVPLKTVATMVEADRAFDALRTLRSLFPIEQAILNGGNTEATRAA